MATTFTNQASLSYSGGTVLSNTAVGAVEGALQIVKQPLTEQYNPGDTLTYVISIVNSGDTAASALTVTDSLGAYSFGQSVLRPLSFEEETLQYYVNGVLQPQPPAAVSDENGLVISNISVPANGSAILIYSASINEFAPLDSGSSVTNNVTLTGVSVCTIEAQATVTVENAPELALLKSVTPVPVAENGELTYSFTLQNSGNTPVTADENAVINDTFVPILTDISVTLEGAPLVSGTGYTYNETTGEFQTAQGVLTVPAATYEQDPVTGEIIMTPGSVALVVSGTVGNLCASEKT